MHRHGATRRVTICSANQLALLPQAALRTLLTTAGITLGVAVFIAMHCQPGVLFAFSTTVDRIAGKTELQVTAGETGFEEDVLERVQAVSSVRVAVPAIEAVVDTNVAGQGNLLVLGVDMTGDRSLRDYDLESGDEAVIDDPLVFLAQPDSIIVTKEHADRAGLAVGGRMPLGTMEGMRFFTVRGILSRAGGPAPAANSTIMDVAHENAPGAAGGSSSSRWRGRTIDECRAELRAAGDGFQIDSPAGRGQQFRRCSARFADGEHLEPLRAVHRMFIIYNSF